MSRAYFAMLAFGGIACGRAGHDSARADSTASAGAPGVPTTTAFTAAQVQHGGVRWAPVALEELAAQLEVPGQLTAHENRTANLGAPADGRVLAVHVRLGERVSRGQPLVTLQSEAAGVARADFDKASATLGAARAQAAYARAARERAGRLLAARAGSRQDAERAAADDELATATLSQARTELARARGAMVRLGVNAATGAMVLRSPLSGIVLSRAAETGVVVTTGDSLVAVTDLRELALELAVPDGGGLTMPSGGSVRFTVRGFPDDTFTARIDLVGGALDPGTRTLPVRASVANESRRLRAGMFATAWIPSSVRRMAALVPDSAVQLLDEQPVVFLAKPDGGGGVRFERRDVTVGGTAGGRTQIVRGLSSGDVIVVAGAFAVKSEFARSRMGGE